MAKPPPPPKPKSAALLSAIEERDELLVQIKALQEREMALRKYIAAQLFPNPKEGVNHCIREGIDAKLTQKYYYKVLEPEYLSLRPTLLKHGVPVSSVFKTSFSLVASEYKVLSKPHRKWVDRVLDIKPSETPDLKINV